MARVLPWAEFKDAVEGRHGARPVAVVDGLPMLAAGPPERKPVPNPALLSELIRGGAPLPGHMLKWLADFFDPEAESLMRVAGLVKRSPGPMPGAVLPHSSTVETFRAALDDGTPRTKALGDMMEAHWIRRTTLEKAIADQEDAEEKHAQAVRED